MEAAWRSAPQCPATGRRGHLGVARPDPKPEDAQAPLLSQGAQVPCPPPRGGAAARAFPRTLHCENGALGQLAHWTPPLVVRDNASSPGDSSSGTNFPSVS